MHSHEGLRHGFFDALAYSQRPGTASRRGSAGGARLARTGWAATVRMAWETRLHTWRSA